MRRITIFILFLLVAVTWGTTWIAMKIALESIPPVFATGMRFLFSRSIINHYRMGKKNTIFVSCWPASISTCN